MALVTVLVVALVAAGCSSTGDGDATSDAGAGSASTTSAPSGYVSDTYREDDAWLCRGAPDDACATADLAATEWVRDGTTRVEEPPPVGEPAVDCFYAYPTVDFTSPPGNVPMDGDPALELDAVRIQGARFRSVCRVFAPRYPQATNAGLSSPDAAQELQVAYDGLLDAFRHYLEQENDGRPFVLIGDGQGADLLVRLLQEQVDGNPDVQPRLLSAILTGTGRVVVPDGQPVGGTFRAIPLCGQRGQQGCVITYTLFGFGSTPDPTAPIFAGIPAGMVTACANPAGLDGSKGQFRAAYFPEAATDPARWVAGDLLTADTPFAEYREYFRGECVDGPGATRYVRVDLVTDPSDQRSQPALTSPLTPAVGGGLQLHVVQIALGDLVFDVEAQVAAAGLDTGS